mmetsp:Transcript_28138/g.27143  ORF Transcript_28138/g.27143 Transcript_28138/m.27143 type:complete len:99 (+) Transcript_28138:756-1052(+)
MMLDIGSHEFNVIFAGYIGVLENGAQVLLTQFLYQFDCFVFGFYTGIMVTVGHSIGAANHRMAQTFLLMGLFLTTFFNILLVIVVWLVKIPLIEMVTD